MVVEIKYKVEIELVYHLCENTSAKPTHDSPLTHVYCEYTVYGK